MSAERDFNALWKKQKVHQPDLADLMKKINVIKRRGIRRIILTNITFAITSAFIILVWINYNPQMFTTKTGIVLVLLSMAIFALVTNRQKDILTNLDSANDNKHFVEQLLHLQKKQKFLHGTLLNLYFIMLSTGIFLYMIEPSRGMSLQGRIVAYGLTLAWILFNWFYIRPRMIKKQRDRLNDVIGGFTELNKQFD